MDFHASVLANAAFVIFADGAYIPIGTLPFQDWLDGGIAKDYTGGKQAVYDGDGDLYCIMWVSLVRNSVSTE